MREKLSHNLKLKIFAILFATGLWMISININDPYQSKDYSVKVQLQNVNAMTSAGKFVEVIDGTDEISVRVRGSRSIMDSFNISNIVATADIKEMDEDFQIPIRLSTVKTSGNKIESMRPSKDYITVKVENILKIQKNISVETKNQPEEGYIIGNTYTEQNALRIAGPESLVKQVEKAVVGFDLSGAKEDVSMLLPIELYDKEGRRIIDSRLSTSINEVQCVAEIYATKEVPIVLMTKGTEAKGYGFTGEILQEPQTVLLAGKNNLLRTIKEVKIEDALDLTGAKENVTTAVDIKEYLSENIILADSNYNGRVNATAFVEKELSIQYPYAVENIIVENLPQGYELEIESKEEILLDILGFESNIKGLTDSDITVTVDIQLHMEEEEITELEETTYEIPAIVDLPDQLWMEKEIKIPVKIVKNK